MRRPSFAFLLSSLILVPRVGTAGTCGELLESGFSKLVGRLPAISRMYVPHNHRAAALLERLPTLSTRSVLEGKVTLERAFVRRADDLGVRGCLGRIFVVPADEDYRLLVVVDDQSRVMVFDSHADITIHSLEGTSAEDRAFLANFGDTTSRFDDEAFRQNLAALTSKTSREMPEHFELPREVADIQRHAFIDQAYGRVSLVGSLAVPAIIVFWSASSFGRLHGWGAHNFLNQHASNFYFCLTGLALLHAGFSRWDLRYRSRWLALLTAVNVLINVDEEINLGFGRWHGRGGVDGLSDWVDFGSGMLAAATYAGIYLAIEIGGSRKGRGLVRLTLPIDRAGQAHEP